MGAVSFTQKDIFTGSLSTDSLTLPAVLGGGTLHGASAWLREKIGRLVPEAQQRGFRPLLEREALCALLKDADDYELEFQLDRDGVPVWHRLELDVTARDADGVPEQYAFSLKNIDRIKRAAFEQEIRDKEREILVNQAFENSSIMKFTYYVKENYGEASQGIEDLHGAPRRMDNMKATFRDNFVDPAYHAIHDEMYDRCLSGINHASCELVDISGHWTRVTLEIVETDEEGKPSVVLGIVENTDELHAARGEAAIMEEVCTFAVNNHYEQANLIDISENTVHSLIKVENVDVGFNHEGYDDYDESVRRQIAHNACTKEDAGLLAALLLENLVPTLEAHGRYSIRCRMHGGDGRPSWKLIESTFFKDDHNKIIMLTTDVQKEEDIKEELRVAAEEAQEANRAKSAFLANMSHEIRTPMNAIVGISEILLGKPLPEDVLMDINTIQNSGSSLLGIINDILDFSKIETGKFEINPTDYMIPSVLMDISNVISVRLSGRPVFFMMDIDPNLPNHLYGDDIRVKQVLLNLIGNSAKFTHEGFIELKADGRFLDGENYELTFEVRDSGIGIKEEDMGKLFKTFSQVDTKRNRAISGSGLGLSISKNLAQMMGGDLTVKSVYGKGSVFTVKILQQVRHYEKIGEVHNKNVRILICEQNETVIRSLRSTLERLGLSYEICRESDKIRNYEGMTHVLVRRKAFLNIKEKLEFMFRQSNIFLVLDNDEHAETHYMRYKQLQLPLMCMQLINALNGEEIVSSIKKKSFDRSQIVPLSFARVLIVDDNTTNLQVAQGLMAPYKMKIDVAISGFKAIEMVKTTRYNAIFMDHMMPEMDGIETTQYIRKLGGDYYENVPIIALTANAMSDAKKMFLESGLDDFVAKPIEMTELNRVLKRFVQPQAPEGYLEQVKKQKEKAGQNADNAEVTAGGAAGTGMGIGISLPLRIGNAGTLPAEAAGGVLQQLLVQNNALLSQNMLLLNGLLGLPLNAGAAASGSAARSGETGAAGAAAGGTTGGQIGDPKGAVNGMPAAGGAPVPAGLSGLTAAEEAADAADSSGENETEALDELRGHIPGVNMQKSVDTYGGSVPIYHNILKTYYYDIKQREPELKQLYEARDLENFTIYVHAIKSASRGVGASELGEKAYALELAGKAGDWETIDRDFAAFMSELHTMSVDVGSYVRTYLETAKSADGEQLAEFPAEIVARLKKASADMDYTEAETLLKELDTRNYAPEAESLLGKMIKHCEGFEYEELDGLIAALS